MITSAELIAHIANMERIDDEIDKMGREWARLTDQEIHAKASFEKWDVWLNTQILAITYCWSYQGGCEPYHISFPVKLVGDPDAFQAAAAAQKAEQDEAARLKEEKLTAERDARERAEFERLRKQFEN